jgi:hypothetical protein
VRVGGVCRSIKGFKVNTREHHGVINYEKFSKFRKFSHLGSSQNLRSSKNLGSSHILSIVISELVQQIPVEARMISNLI